MPTRTRRAPRLCHSTVQPADSDPGCSDYGALVSSALVGGSKKRRFAAREVIYREGDDVDKVLVILSGMAKLLSYQPNGRARIVSLHNHHHWLGLEGLLDQPYEHTAVAVDNVEGVYISMNYLHLLERDNLRQYCQLLKQGYRHLAQADRCLADLSTGGIRSRVARLVDFLAKLEFGESSKRVKLLTVHEMADMLGVTPESVSRIMAEFKRNDTLRKLDGLLDEIYEINAEQLQHEARQ